MILGMMFGLIVCLTTFVSLRCITVDIRKDWDLVLVESIMVGVFYLLIDAIFFSQMWYENV